MPATRIADNVYYVGVKDFDLRIFDIYMETKSGTTYNAYLVKGEKTALIDGVKKEFTDEWLAGINSITPVDQIEYLVVNHTEPDHSGSLTRLLELNPTIKIYCSGPALPFVRNVLNQDADMTGVKDNYEIDLGGKKLIFKITPYMHWPDTMMEYLPEDRILFSCDGFAAHLATDALYEDELQDKSLHGYEYKQYYEAIMRPFSGFIGKNLKKLEGLELALIAPSHGPLLRDKPRQYIDRYVHRVNIEPAYDAAIFHTTNYGNTSKIAQVIGERLQAEGLTVVLADAVETDPETVRDLIEGSRCVLIGSPTFNGDAVKPIWDVVNQFATVFSIGKKAAVFGSYGWGGQAPELIAARLSGLKLKVYEQLYRARLVPSDEEFRELDAFCIGLKEFIGPRK
jgi:flavorubredoxin